MADKQGVYGGAASGRIQSVSAFFFGQAAGIARSCELSQYGGNDENIHYPLLSYSKVHSVPS